ncbi:MAG: hypothetical protein KAT04_01065, partial [Methylococcales bacterium]|nr:hypothetical protein [Methylococcales bacterium]
AEIKQLRRDKLIEGRKPNFHISFKVAKSTGQIGDYIKMRGIDDAYCKKVIVDYLKKFSEGTRADFEGVLLNKLPEILNEQQKKTKIKNNLQSLRKLGVIYLDEGKKWRMSK